MLSLAQRSQHWLCCGLQLLTQLSEPSEPSLKTTRVYKCPSLFLPLSWPCSHHVISSPLQLCIESHAPYRFDHHASLSSIWHIF